MIDEAGNTPLRWLPDVASTCSGIGIQLVTVWQSLAQMRAIYQAQTGSLLTNHGSKIFFSGLSDRETLEYASYLGGDEEVAQRSTTTDVGLRGDRRTVASSTTSMRLRFSQIAQTVHGPLRTRLDRARAEAREAAEEPAQIRPQGLAAVRHRAT